MVLIVVERFTKMAHSMATQGAVTSKDRTDLYKTTHLSTTWIAKQHCIRSRPTVHGKVLGSPSRSAWSTTLQEASVALLIWRLESSIRCGNFGLAVGVQQTDQGLSIYVLGLA
jgi:hypothetical protein